MSLASAAAMREDQVELETLKLLVQVAWADHHIAPEEVEHIMSLARLTELSEDEFAVLQAALFDEGRLPAPNMGLLREHPDQVMRAIDQLIAIDRQVVGDERAVRDAVAYMLTQP